VRFSRLLAAAAFAVGALALLALWARGSSPSVPLPAYRSLSLGLLAAALGLGLVTAGLFARWGEKEGLSAGPWPPVRRISTGVYRLLPHPIAAGFCFLCFGSALALGSPGGLWLVVPMVVLAAIAWYLGRGEDPRPDHAPAFLHIPEEDDVPPSLSDRWSVGILVLFAWLAIYEAIMALGIPADAHSLATAAESGWPVWEWSELFYIGTYPFVMAVPFAMRTRRQLRVFTRQAWAAMALALPMFLLLPFISPPRPFTATSPLGELLLWERKYDAASNAFPSFHVTWALLSALAWSRAWPRLRALWWMLGLAIAASTVTTGMHTIADVASAVAVVFLVTRLDAVRAAARGGAEAMARTWRSARRGALVIHHHGLYSGLAAGAAVGLAGALVPWGEEADLWLLAGVAAIALPWAGAALRLRALVGGGGPESIPADFFPFLAWDLATGIFLLRLWSLDAAPTLIAGVWLLLAGCGWFAEGRAAPALQRRGVLAFLAGAFLTTVPSHGLFPPPSLSWTLAGAAAAAGAVSFLVFGVEYRPGERPSASRKEAKP
jgi:hypothetical protein